MTVMAKKLNLLINGTKCTVDQGTTILDAAKMLNIKIPTLCYHKDLCVAGNCRVCVVEVVIIIGIVSLRLSHF